jgi:hypothetical protein
MQDEISLLPAVLIEKMYPKSHWYSHETSQYYMYEREVPYNRYHNDGVPRLFCLYRDLHSQCVSTRQTWATVRIPSVTGTKKTPHCSQCGAQESTRLYTLCYGHKEVTM